MATSNVISTNSGLQLELESASPHTLAVADWVVQHSKNEQPSKASLSKQRDSVVTPPPRRDHDIDSQATPRPKTCQRAKIVYSIERLLQLREARCTVPVLLRVRPEAIAENIFQYMGAHNANRFAHRSSILSDVSNLSHASTATNNRAAFSGVGQTSLGQGLRAQISNQDSVPPKKDGFVRFLIQHASPPHHRVTAGGRIVPAGPTSPPPMLDFASLNSIARERQATVRPFQQDARQVPRTSQAHNLQTTKSLLTPMSTHMSTTGEAMMGQSPIPLSGLQQAYPYGTSGYQPQTLPLLQNCSTIVTHAVFPDGSTLVSYGGTSYRAYWNGANMVMEPLQTLPFANNQQLQASGVNFPQANESFPGYGPEARTQNAATATSSSIARSKRRDNTRSRSQSLSMQFNSDFSGKKGDILKNQLNRLDRYLALNHYDISPSERSTYVAQRRYLVEEIDRLRVSEEELQKDQSKHVIPIIEPTTGAPLTTQNAKEFEMGTKQEKPSAASSSALKVASEAKQVNSGLSPAAPAFVPRSQNGHSPNKSFVETPQPQGKTPVDTAKKVTERNHPVFNIKEVASAAISRKSKALERQNGALPSSQQRQFSTSSVLDPSDPAMRVVEHSDIEYAGRYLYNWSHEKKTYCTTIAEFQEAIRCVREQARLYGCEGGNSKDPAYDAEQDIWWAICDRDPIPLPSDVPDHVSNPRPWNWNNSAFNYRRSGAPMPGPEIDNARNSPRLAGWDPVITESMKDRMDFSRSYFALRGLLPSVPFRDWAFDQQGNKVKVGLDGSDTKPKVRDESQKARVAPSTEVALDKNTAGTGALSHLTPSDLNSRGPAELKTPLNKSRKQKFASEGDAIELKSKSDGRVGQPKQGLEQTIDNPNDNKADMKSKSKLAEPKAPVNFPKRKPLNKKKKSKTSDQPRQPETPVTRRVRADSNGSPTPKMGKRNDKRDESHPNPIHAPYQKKPVDAPDNQLSRDNVKLENVTPEKDPENSVLHAISAEAKTTPSHHSFQSKSIWAAGQDRSPITDQVSSSEDLRDDKPPPKVNIPNTVYEGISQPGQYSPDLLRSQAIEAPAQELSPRSKARQVKSESQKFLRRMLKSPAFSSAQSFKFPNIMSTMLSKTSKTEAASRKADKGNVSSSLSYEADATEHTPTSDSSSRPSSPIKSMPGPSLTKAQSSLASSTYQAQGQMPQFFGAGQACVASLYDDQKDKPPLPVRISLPINATYERESVHQDAAYQRVNLVPNDATAGIHAKAGFGFDGGTDAAPAKEQSTNSTNDPNFDYKGVSTTDFEIKRPSTESTWYQGEVEDFFQDLKHEEEEMVADYQREKLRKRG